MRVAVVGAGIAGLATAFQLMRRGEDVTVFEASERAGGVIGTLDRDGFLLETAANGFLNREPAMLELVDALGLRARLRAAHRAAKARFVFTRGRARKVPSSPLALLKSDLVPFGTKLRLASEWFFASRTKVEDESLGSFARRHLGARATAVLVDAIQTGVFAGDVEKLSVAAAFPKLAELEREHRSLVSGSLHEEKKAAASKGEWDRLGLDRALTTFDGGMQVLIDALVSALGARVQLRSEVRALTREGSAWRVSFADRPVVTADHVVLACPSYVTGKLLEAPGPALGDELRDIRYAPISVVHLGYRRLANPPQGFGVLFPHEEGRRILGALYVSSFFPHRVPEKATLLTVMVGGAKRAHLAPLNEADLVALAREELAATIGLSAEPDLTHVIRWSRGIPQYEVGHLARMARIDQHLAELPGLHLAGNPYRGVSVLDAVKQASTFVL